MMFRTIRESAELLGISMNLLRKAAKSGDVPSMMIGSRMMVDVDEARKIISRFMGVGIGAVAAETGLPKTAVRRGIREGWIPYYRPGREYLFDMDEVKAALAARTGFRDGGKSDNVADMFSEDREDDALAAE